MPKKDVKYYEALPYRVDLYFDQDDQVWVARYPELPGCVAHGETKEEAIANSDEVKSLWLETAIESGDIPPEPQPELSYSGKFVLRLPKTLHERAAQAAEREGVSLNQYLNSAIAEKLGAGDLFNRLVEKLQQPIGQLSLLCGHSVGYSYLDLQAGQQGTVFYYSTIAGTPASFLPQSSFFPQWALGGQPQTQPEARHGGS